MNMNEMTKHLMLVASSTDNYCKHLNEDYNRYANILGYVYRVHQDKVRKISPQGLALILIFLKDIEEKEYGKYIDAFKDKVDEIITTSKTIDEQLDKMKKIKDLVE